ncbi:MAG TPA: cell division protein ZapD [Burkholderiales bacterium]|nr:cell division protein ZapD [Burkholderiales bacterium]
MSAAVISYDYPLNERIRTLLRLEHLFDKADFYVSRDDRLDHHAAVMALFEMMDVTTRADLKSELLQEVERHKSFLEPLQNNPSIDLNALNEVLTQLKDINHILYTLPGKTGQHLRENDWLMSIRQRAAIPGGLCEFDAPSYHYWLHQDAATRRNDLDSWLNPMRCIQKSLSLILKLLREAGQPGPQVAHQGSYQQVLSGRSAQLLRIKMPDHSEFVPEISANRYAINIRFTVMDGQQKPRTAEQDVAFNLMLCSL